MNIAQIEINLSALVNNFSEESFVYDLLLAYGTPKATVSLLKKGKRNLSQREDQIILKRKLFFQETKGQDLHVIIDELKNTETTHRHKPRFIVVTDYKTLLAIDTKTNATLDIDIKTLNKHFDFFLPLAGMEKAQHKNENPADVKAAEKMARIYDEILKDNPYKTDEEIHSLNIFLSRLLFCFFAEDTDIFNDSVFTNSISSHTQVDGSDLDDYLNKLFEVMNTDEYDREALEYPAFLEEFPYVNGGLFADEYAAPKFSRKSRKMIIECGELNWAEINPDIFGSMIQAVVHPDQRSGMGMHYTSVPNIMKVIEPLFLNELQEELEKHYDDKKKLEKLLIRLENLRIFDPACGSGNFLIIAYKELRSLEMEIFRRIDELSGDSPELPLSRIKLSQFYGIELDDFAHEVAILSLWLAEHQMNVQFKEEFGHSKPSLPLEESGNIVCGNATRVDWEDVCPKDESAEIYILGNPPYQGFKMQTPEQKKDMSFVFNGDNNYKSLDFISCWFFQASKYINHKTKAAFVSTNSICQGAQVELLWPKIYKNDVEISFAVHPFKWSNNAKKNAGVTCIIIGLRKRDNKDRFIIKQDHYTKAKNINPYLVDGDNIIITKRKTSLSSLPKISDGSGALDGGNLILSDEEKNILAKECIEIKSFIRPYLGSNEFIKGISRWCLWIEDTELNKANKILQVKNRIDKVRSFRINAGTRAQTAINRPHKFAWINAPKNSQIIIPTVSSERREYIPMGFIDSKAIVSNAASIVHDPEPWVFGVITSKIHMVWVKAVAGKLEERIRYTSVICYNTFPVPDLTDKQKQTITTHVYNVLEEREKHSEKTMAQLYDPDKMPDGLREAHHNLDIAVERCYRSKPFTSDEERLEYLFKLYERMTNQKTQGELL